jgi:large exoprotein involved in heme utilization and adhesion
MGSYATSYISTTSASATRVADACFKTGISSLIGQSEGTVFWDIEVETLSASGNENIFNLDAGSYGNTLYFIKGSTGVLSAEIYVIGVVQCSFSYSLPSVGRYKMALGYKANDFAFYVNGVSRGTDSSGSVPAMSRLQMGNGVFGPSDGKTNQAILFPTRLTNAELASLTTL